MTALPLPDLVSPDPSDLIRSLDYLRAAMRLVAPIAALPPAPVRLAIRQASGVPRETVAVLLGCSLSSVVRMEEGAFATARSVDEAAYRTLLAVLLVHLRDHNPEALSTIRHLWSGGHKPARSISNPKGLTP